MFQNSTTEQLKRNYCKNIFKENTYRLALTDGMGRPQKINEHLSLNVTNLQKEQGFFVWFFSLLLLLLFRNNC